MKILIINGPNLNMLGIREPEVYGKQTYKDLVKLLKSYAKGKDIDLTFYQSNHEGEIVDKIQKAYFKKTDGIVINPGAYTHTSIAILDALKSVNIPTVEVHISALDKREDFRQNSFVSLVAVERVIGKGLNGYVEAVEFLKKYLSK